MVKEKKFKLTSLVLAFFVVFSTFSFTGITVSAETQQDTLASQLKAAYAGKSTGISNDKKTSMANEKSQSGISSINSVTDPSLKTKISDELKAKVNSVSNSTLAEQSSIMATTYSVNESEYNDTLPTADLLTSSFISGDDYCMFGTITNTSADVDLYKFTLTKSGTVDALGIWLGSYYDYGWEDDLYIGIFNSSGTLVDVSSYSSAGASVLDTHLSSGTYYLAVTANDYYGDLYVGETYGINLDYYSDATVTFNSQGGSAVPSQTVPYYSYASVPTQPTRTGYTFGGWYKEASCTTPWNFSYDAVTVNTTLYAKWIPITYTVSFNSMGGSYVSNQTAGYNAIISAPPAPVMSGYVFMGWYKDSSYTYPWNFSTDKVNSNITLYAKWAKACNVTYNSMGGNYVSGNTVAYGSVLATPAAPTRTGYTFGGWYADPSCTSAWNFTTDKVYSDITLYAKWTINSYTVTFNSQGGTTVTGKTAYYNSTITAPADPSRIGFVFGGWYKDSTYQTLWNFSTDTVTANTTLYAKWTSRIDVIAGANRYLTAVEISKKSYETSDTAILATAWNFPDALVAGPLAFQENAPILLTAAASLPQATIDELLRLKVSKVIIMGSEEAVGPQVVTTLNGLGITVERVSGSSRFETAVETAKRVRAKSGVTNKVILATGWNFPDALSIGSYASKEGIPILLSGTDDLTAATKNALIEFGTSDVLIVGGYPAVSINVENQLVSMGINVTRVSGSSRFATSVQIAEDYFPTATKAVVATGRNFPDALAAVPYAAKINSPLILTEVTSVPAEVSAYIQSSPIVDITVVGGDPAVAPATRDTLASLLKY